jgi:Metallo-beta-lactamase superfamily
MKLTLLPSDKGDCLLLESRDGTTILIDGGMSDSYTHHVRPFLADWRNKQKRPLDLVYVSHIDQDHIAGVLQLMNDIVEWRVYNHKQKQGENWPKPKFSEPPEVARLWHNAFHDLIGENVGEVASMLAARGAQLATNANLELQKLGADYQAIAASVPEAIKLSRRVSANQLKIPLNEEFGGPLAMVREPPDPPDQIRLKGAGSPLIRVIGPFKKDVDKFRDKWEAWLRANKKKLSTVERWAGDEDARLGLGGVVALGIDDELGNRRAVTEENLASLMLFVEHDGKTILLTGDGHHTDIIAGLERNHCLAEGKGLHVNVLKVQHHGSEHNLDREFAKRITADHYVICGNGLHENPDLRVLQVIAESRLGSDDQLSTNSQAKGPFEVWFNCSSEFLKNEIAQRGETRGSEKYEKAAAHFAKVEQDMNRYVAQSGGALKVRYLVDEPLVLDLAA